MDPQANPTERYLERVRKMRRLPSAGVRLLDVKGQMHRFTGSLQKLCETLQPTRVNDQLLYKYRVFLSDSPKNIGFGCGSLFTLASKMVCPSFGLPAGPPALGGCCVHSNNKRLFTEGVNEHLYICHNCYAVDGNYARNLSTQVGQLARKLWVAQQLEAGTFVDEMIQAYDYWLGRSHRTIVIPYNKVTRTLAYTLPTDPRFFRIHDSGDFLWHKGYFTAWVDITTAFPHVLFWAPTRDYNTPAFVELVSSISRPANFILRPSSLFIGDPAPSVQGLDAGSTACFLDEPADGRYDRQCPAGKGAGKRHNCHDQNCRLCWKNPDVSVSYAPHGNAGEYLAQKRVERENPLSDDAENLRVMGLDEDDVVAALEGLGENQPLMRR